MANSKPDKTPYWSLGFIGIALFFLLIGIVMWVAKVDKVALQKQKEAEINAIKSRLYVAGVTPGGKLPMALINEEAYTIGNTISGFKIVEIGSNYVSFSDDEGNMFDKMVGEGYYNSGSSSSSSNTSSSYSIYAEAAATRIRNQMMRKSAEDLHKALEYLGGK
jgi:hypothetical protein